MEFLCNICNKNYKSYQSRWNHMNKFHTPDISQNKAYDKPNDKPEKIEGYKCTFCKKKYVHYQSRWKHEQKCKDKKNDKIQILETKLENMEKIQSELLKSMKIHPKTLQKINNQLNNNGIVNNINTINNIIIPLSEQNLKKALKKSEKMDILNSGSKAHLKLTDILYNKPEYKKFRNIYITNLSNNIGYVYDKNKNCFIVKNKKDILDDYGVERFSDIQYFYEELKMKINDNQLIKLKKMVTDYFNDNDFKDIKNKELLIELYNNRVQVQQIYETVNKNVKEIEI